MSDKTVSFEDPLQSLASVLNSTTAYRDAQLADAGQLIHRLKNEWVAIRDEDLKRNVRENHHFNPLRRITIKETDHSRILAELLDPLGSHAQGSIFLDSFLTMLGMEPGGNWTVTPESARVDIMLRRERPASVVIIENKAHKATDQEGQLYRYWFDQIHSPFPDLSYEDPKTARHFKVVYLPPGSFSLPDETSLSRPSIPPYESCGAANLPRGILDCRSFRGDIVGWLQGFQDRDFSPRLKSFLTLYTEIWEL